MRSGAISNAQINASSEWDSNLAAIQSRLNFKAIPRKSGSWSARRNDLNQWLQVFLGGQLTDVTGIATQGRSDYNYWVTRYRLVFSDNGGTFRYYKENGQTLVKVRYRRLDKRDLQVCLLNILKLSSCSFKL
jgi:hypothetical protein